MAIDLECERDLSLIFERDDVHDAFAGHCTSTHLDAESVRQCPRCGFLRLVLVDAIVEWLAMVDLDRAERAAKATVPRSKGSPSPEQS